MPSACVSLGTRNSRGTEDVRGPGHQPPTGWYPCLRCVTLCQNRIPPASVRTPSVNRCGRLRRLSRWAYATTVSVGRHRTRNQSQFRLQGAKPTDLEGIALVRSDISDASNAGSYGVVDSPRPPALAYCSGEAADRPRENWDLNRPPFNNFSSRRDFPLPSSLAKIVGNPMFFALAAAGRSSIKSTRCVTRRRKRNFDPILSARPTNRSMGGENQQRALV
jgi:hypothetical protein